jgi:hypothetical protein
LKEIERVQSAEIKNQNINITKNTELESRNQTNFQTLNSMWVTQIFFKTKFVITEQGRTDSQTEQGRNDSQTISHKDNVGPSCLHTQVNFFDKMCDGIELRWLLPTSRNTAACKFGLPKIMHSIPTLPKHFLWG